MPNQPFSGVKQIVNTGTSQITQFIRENPIVSGAALGGGVLAGLGIVQRIRKRKKKTRRKKKSTRRKRRSYKKRTKKRKTKRSKRGSKKIYKTKNGQPYIILASGKARFISKRSASARRKRKGGYY